ncbi:ribosome biogenesis GTPase Der [Pseudahrensia aquimaris]|uniref:GTPase Der n=1 Tax=Pseudahrensia aquimaris TaxID=744461 RepID=A0ABW3FC17_9HYPH
MSFTIAIAGRPNVGKSTLFNRLVGKRLALVDDSPGVTRDRRMADAKLLDLKFKVIDTAGLEEAAHESLEGRMRQQTEMAILEADATLFLIDARAGVTPLDEGFANLLRRAGKPVILVANKAEGKRGDAGLYEAYAMGFGEPIAFSAEHGEGIVELRDALIEAVGHARALGEEEAGEDEDVIEGDDEEDFDIDPSDDTFEIEFDEEDDVEEEYDTTKPMRIAIVGRPNAGKSTLINTMVDEDRLLTGPEAGITRDSISVEWEWQGRQIKLFDTAGMRRKARVQEKLEKLSVADGLRAVQFAEVVVIVFDATIPFEKQDLQIVDLIAREGRAPIIAYNKWDLIKDKQATLNELHEKCDRLLPQIRGVRTVTLSGQTGKGVDKLMEAVLEAHKVWNRRISTSKLNRWLDGVQAHHPPPAVSGRRVRLKYATQAKSRPPTFMVQCSRPEGLPTSYTRYLINELREDFDLWGVPLRLFLRKGENPFANRRRKKN